MSKPDTIFVQIASYRDPQLIPTLHALIDNALHPENLHIGICWQHADDEGFDIFANAGFDPITTVDDAGPTGHPLFFTGYKGATFTIIDVPHTASKGACWARWSIQQLYAEEKYTLQLDSHHRFVPHWDKLCIDMLESLRYKSKKPLLTAYIPSFDPENDPAGRDRNPWQMNFDRFIPEGAVFFMPAAIDNHANLTEPMRARYYSAHFCFVDGSFATEVQHDPEYFFHGEEISIAARAFTHGYDLYHPHIIVAWHEYTRKNRTKVWDDHTTGAKSTHGIEKDWVERNNECHFRNRTLFSMDGLKHESINWGKYGFGTERTLRDYEEYAGMDFALRGIQQVVLDKKEPVWPVGRSWTPEEWKASIVGSHDIHICVHTSRFDRTITDYEFCYVGAHDANGEIFRKDLTGAEFMSYLKEDWVNYRFIFNADRTPTYYTLWPRSISKDWQAKVDVDIPKN